MFLNQKLNFFSFVLLFNAISPLVARSIWFDPNFTLFQIANMIRFLVDSYNKPVPAILEIPSKDHPYDPAHDSVLSRVRYLFSAESVASGRRWILSGSHATNHSMTFVFCYRCSFLYKFWIFSTIIIFHCLEEQIILIWWSIVLVISVSSVITHIVAVFRYFFDLAASLLTRVLKQFFLLDSYQIFST